ncbi:hypothetical protein GCM10007392_08350 [Saccharospirillum salsuginis]|uniref:Uncharacterized protein n=2 Tax=Saccharospirillum salsuginis TaxID=418750 RepID=A0A918K3Q7_9GAMM|nr:hypothetical protein GCM10007392_08350 [Saccharospirillum salsuginis]
MLLIVLVAVVGGFVVTHQIIAGKVGDRIDQMSDNMAAAGSLNHGNIFITPTGTALINRVVFYPNGTSGDVRIERVAIRTGSLKALYDLGQGMQGGQPPENLTVDFEGIQADLGDNFLQPVGQGATSQPADFFAAGCGERTYFSFADRDAMGYQSMLSDMTLQYRFQPGPNRLTVSGEWITRGMAGVEYSADLQLPSGQAGLQLHHARVRLVDHGYMDAVLNFCARETGLDVASYRQQHLAAWEANWANFSMVPGDGLVAAYGDFVEKPGSLTLETYPEINFMQAMMNPTPEALFQLLDPRIRANDGEPRPFRVAVAMEDWRESGQTGEAETDSENSDEKPETVAQPEEPTSSKPKIKRLGRSEWSTHLNQPVWLTLNDGRRLEGMMLSLDGERMRFQQNVYNGQMVMPLRIDEISDVHLQPSPR